MIPALGKCSYSKYRVLGGVGCKNENKKKYFYTYQFTFTFYLRLCNIFYLVGPTRYTPFIQNEDAIK